MKLKIVTKDLDHKKIIRDKMKKYAIFSTCLTLLMSLMAYGDEGQKKSDPIHPNCIYFGPEVFVLDLNTHIKNIKVDGVSVFEGLRLRYEYLKPENFYAGLDLFSAVSNQTLKAKWHDFHFHRNSNITGFSNIELRVGYNFAPKNIILTPFLGAGGYYFANYGHHFHFREVMLYYGVGMRSLYELSHLFSVGFNWKVFHTGGTERRFKYLFMGNTVKRTDNGNFWGGEIGVPLVWYVGATRRWEIQVEPYFLKLDFSEIQNIYGTRILCGYRF